MKVKKIVALLLCMTIGIGVLGAGCHGMAFAEGNAHYAVQKQAQEPNPVMQFDSTLKDGRVVVDGLVHVCDILVADGKWYITGEDAQKAFGGVFSEAYIALKAYARSADIRYTQDEALHAAYFSTWDTYAEKTDIVGFESYAAELKLPLDKLEKRYISGIQMAELLDCFVAHEAPDQMPEWEKISKNLRSSFAPLCRMDALSSLFLAAWTVGGVYMDYEKESTMHMRDAAFDKVDEKRNWTLFQDVPIPKAFDIGYGGVDHYANGAAIFNLGSVSPVDLSHPFAFDGTSFRHNEYASYLDAVVAICRVFSRSDTLVVPVSHPAATVLSGFFTEKLLNKATASSKVTAENHPQWTGFVLNGEQDFDFDELPGQIELCANWGFNSARINLEYEQLFNRNVTEVNLAQLTVLDKIVAKAVQYNMHLNICLTSLPGRWRMSTGEFQNKGDFDLFLNRRKQEQAKRIFEVLAARYKGFSNDYLSFTPVFEPLNHNLSTGLPFTYYTYDDYAKTLDDLIHTIRNVDPQRLIIVEPTMMAHLNAIQNEAKPVYEVLADEDGIIASYNYADYNYTLIGMTTVEGRDIDNENRSCYLPEYPTYHYYLNDCIVDPQKTSLRRVMPEGSHEGSSSLFIDGFLPAGTTVELHIGETFGGQLQLIADGKVVYSEDLDRQVYDVGEAVSGYINYAVSDKVVSVTLAQETEMLEIATPNGALIWTAMDLRLPKEYARERWYYATPYDVFCGLEARSGLMLKKEARVMIWPFDPHDQEHRENRLTIQEDLTFSTPTLRGCATQDSIMYMMREMEETWPGCIVRYERAILSGGISEDIMQYYEDMFQALDAYHIGWWSNDFWVMTNDMSEFIAGIQQTSYGQYPFFNLELLKLMQRFQSNERP